MTIDCDLRCDFAGSYERSVLPAVKALERDVEKEHIEAERETDAAIAENANCSRVGSLINPSAQILTKVVQNTN